MKETLKMIGDTMLRIVLYLVYMPFAVLAVLCGAFALSLQRMFSYIINGDDYEEDTYEEVLIKLIALFL